MNVDKAEDRTETPRPGPLMPQPVSALAREELKYAHLSRRETEAIRANRAYLAAHIAAIQSGSSPDVDTTTEKDTPT